MPNALVLESKTVEHLSNASIKVRLIFRTSKNEPLGVVQLAAVLLPPMQQRILDFWPSTDCSGFYSGNDSKIIIGDGMAARLVYTPISATATCVDLTLSGPSQVQIQGNNDLRTFVIDVK